ncbi:MAG TPA: hypothetical protein VK501_17075 [Baekduia sp.]|nr:hypothetical protein [Baekduia sp.]HMJ35625.1 hypothetical protein [Baekduia sp.]
MADRLALDLRSGAKHQLSWMTVDRADVPLLTAWGIEPPSPAAFGRR